MGVDVHLLGRHYREFITCLCSSGTLCASWPRYEYPTKHMYTPEAPRLHPQLTQANWVPEILGATMGVHTKLGLFRGFLYMLRPHVLVGIVMMVVAILMIAGGSICCLVFLALWISSLTGASSGKRVVLTRSSSSMRHEDEPLSQPSGEAGSDDDDLSGEA